MEIFSQMIFLLSLVLQYLDKKKKQKKRTEIAINLAISIFGVWNHFSVHCYLSSAIIYIVLKSKPKRANEKKDTIEKQAPATRKSWTDYCCWRTHTKNACRFLYFTWFEFPFCRNTFSLLIHTSRLIIWNKCVLRIYINEYAALPLISGEPKIRTNEKLNHNHGHMYTILYTMLMITINQSIVRHIKFTWIYYSIIIIGEIEPQTRRRWQRWRRRLGFFG